MYITQYFNLVYVSNFTIKTWFSRVNHVSWKNIYCVFQRIVHYPLQSYCMHIQCQKVPLTFEPFCWVHKFLSLFRGHSPWHTDYQQCHESAWMTMRQAHPSDFSPPLMGSVGSSFQHIPMLFLHMDSLASNLQPVMYQWAEGYPVYTHWQVVWKKYCLWFISNNEKDMTGVFHDVRCILWCAEPKFDLRVNSIFCVLNVHCGHMDNLSTLSSNFLEYFDEVLTVTVDKGTVNC